MSVTLSPDDFSKEVHMNHIEKYTRREEEAMRSFYVMLMEPSITATVFINIYSEYFSAMA
jgi:hypothetical protein